MPTRRHLLTALLLLPLLAGGAFTAAAADAPRVKLQTSLGDIVLELDPARAPATVENFLAYVRDGFYDGTIFHRVIEDFMIQGGGFSADYERRETRAPIRNEADNGLQNLRGTIAMARTGDPHSATAQFFINVKDNTFLDHTAPTPRGWGYCVFGRVVEGMETVDRIRAVATGAGGPFPKDAPLEAVVIERASLVDSAE
jgi:peptidyl-prolyl cis-trans isomerase B (cyclophilin B)